MLSRSSSWPSGGSSGPSRGCPGSVDDIRDPLEALLALRRLFWALKRLSNDYTCPLEAPQILLYLFEALMGLFVALLVALEDLMGLLINP